MATFVILLQKHNPCVFVNLMVKVAVPFVYIQAKESKKEKREFKFTLTELNNHLNGHSHAQTLSHAQVAEKLERQYLVSKYYK